MPHLDVKVAGTSFRDTNKTYLTKLAQMKHGRYPKAKLVRQPDNEHDTNAIKVIVGRNNFVGFVPRENAARVAELMDAGVTITAEVLSCEIWAEHPTNPSLKIRIHRP